MERLNLKLNKSINMEVFCADWDETVDEYIKKHKGGEFISINKKTRGVNYSGCLREIEFLITSNIISSPQQK